MIRDGLLHHSSKYGTHGVTLHAFLAVLNRCQILKDLKFKFFLHFIVPEVFNYVAVLSHLVIDPCKLRGHISLGYIRLEQLRVQLRPLLPQGIEIYTVDLGKLKPSEHRLSESVVAASFAHDLLHLRFGQPDLGRTKRFKHFDRVSIFSNLSSCLLLTNEIVRDP